MYALKYTLLFKCLVFLFFLMFFFYLARTHKSDSKDLNCYKRFRFQISAV